MRSGAARGRGPRRSPGTAGQARASRLPPGSPIPTRRRPDAGRLPALPEVIKRLRRSSGPRKARRGKSAGRRATLPGARNVLSHWTSTPDKPRSPASGREKARRRHVHPDPQRSDRSAVALSFVAMSATSRLRGVERARPAPRPRSASLTRHDRPGRRHPLGRVSASPAGGARLSATMPLTPEGVSGIVVVVRRAVGPKSAGSHPRCRRRLPAVARGCVPRLRRTPPRVASLVPYRPAVDEPGDLSLKIVAAQIQVQSVLVSLRLRNSHEQIAGPLT